METKKLKNQKNQKADETKNWQNCTLINTLICCIIEGTNKTGCHC